MPRSVVHGGAKRTTALSQPIQPVPAMTRVPVPFTERDSHEMMSAATIPEPAVATMGTLQMGGRRCELPLYLWDTV